MPHKGEIPPARFQQLSRGVAAVVAGIGVAVLFGWWLDLGATFFFTLGATGGAPLPAAAEAGGAYAG